MYSRVKSFFLKHNNQTWHWHYKTISFGMALNAFWKRALHISTYVWHHGIHVSILHRTTQHSTCEFLLFVGLGWLCCRFGVWLRSAYLWLSIPEVTSSLGFTEYSSGARSKRWCWHQESMESGGLRDMEEGSTGIPVGTHL